MMHMEQPLIYCAGGTEALRFACTYIKKAGGFMDGEIYNINSGTDSLIDSQDESENWWEIKETPKINYTDFVF